MKQYKKVSMPAGRMHADELAIDVALVRRLLAGQFPQWGYLPIEPVPSAGTDNALYRLGDDMAVRLPRIHWAVKDVEKEHQWLPRLAPLLPVAIPVPLGRGEPAEGYPWRWSVYRWLDGENPAVDRIADRGSLARELAQFVAALHRIDPTGGPPAAAYLWKSETLRPAPQLIVDGRLSAVIDFGDLGVGDPACDLIVAWNLLPVDIRG